MGPLSMQVRLSLFHTHTHTLSLVTHTLSLSHTHTQLNGIIDAAVNGGTKLYIEAFLHESYLTEFPADANKQVCCVRAHDLRRTHHARTPHANTGGAEAEPARRTRHSEGTLLY